MDQKEFTKIVQKYQQPLLYMIFRLVHSMEQARDICQEAFIRFWTYREKFDQEQKGYALLYRIALNLARDFFRRQPVNKIQLNPETTVIPESSDHKEIIRLINVCAHDLKPRQKIVFILHDIEGLSYHEISDVLQEPVPNIRSNIYLARKNIRKKLIKHYKTELENFNVMQ